MKTVVVWTVLRKTDIKFTFRVMSREVARPSRAERSTFGYSARKTYPSSSPVWVVLSLSSPH